MLENAKCSRLQVIFNTLDEGDKDTVIRLSESLVTKYQNNMPENACKIHKKTGSNGYLHKFKANDV